MKKDKDILAIDDTYVISQRKGNGCLVRKVWVCSKGRVTKYSLAYINLNLFSGDNGRVLGFDNSHGYHHKHLFGQVIPVSFLSFEETESIFEKEFEEIHNENFKKNKS